MGNIASACCDLWSNEQVENLRLFRGSAPQVFLEILYYDCKLMNKAIMPGKTLELRDMLDLSDKFNDPRALVLSPDIAIEIANAIVSEHGDYYRIVTSACEKWLSCLRVRPPEACFLSSVKKTISSLPDEVETFREQMCKTFTGKVPTFRKKDYWP